MSSTTHFRYLQRGGSTGKIPDPLYVKGGSTSSEYDERSVVLRGLITKPWPPVQACQNLKCLVLGEHTDSVR